MQRAFALTGGGIAVLVLLVASGCSRASGNEAQSKPCPKNKYESVYFAVDKAGRVVIFPMEELQHYQVLGYWPATQEQAKAYVRGECPAGFQ